MKRRLEDLVGTFSMVRLVYVRRQALVGLVVVGLCVAGCSPPPPDLLLVTIDTLRADHCSAYGYEVTTTPFLDELASQGVRFARAYAASATTGPSHAALFTSIYPRSLGVMKNGQELGGGFVTLAELMADDGFATAAFVSSFPVRARFGFGQGFEYFDDDFTPEGASRNPGVTMRLDRRAEVTATRVVEWLARRGDDRRPLFAWVHFVDPHYPYHANDPLELGWPAQTPRHVRGYDSEVSRSDTALARVVTAFRESASRDALVIVTSDHGEGLGDHAWAFHGINLYEEAVRVPLVISWPGRIDAGRVESSVVSLLDLAPTVTKLLGVRTPPEFEGRAILPEAGPETAVYLQRRYYRNPVVRGQPVAGPRTAIVLGKWKYVSTPQQQSFELYDLDADAGELHNLALNGHPGVAKLAGLLSRWEKSHPPLQPLPVANAGEDQRALRALGYVD